MMIHDPGKVSGLLDQVAVCRDDRVANLQPRSLGGGTGMDTGHLNVTAICIANRSFIDSQAGKGKGSGHRGSGGLEWRRAVG